MSLKMEVWTMYFKELLTIGEIAGALNKESLVIIDIVSSYRK